MQFTKAIYYKDGQCLTITDHESEAIKQRLLAGDKFVEVQGDFISADNIARIGSHHATYQIHKQEQANLETTMKLEGRDEELEQLYEARKRLALSSVGKESKEAKSIVAKGYDEPDYYLTENGDKMYS
jgi:hypothetical protein